MRVTDLFPAIIRCPPELAKSDNKPSLVKEKSEQSIDLFQLELPITETIFFQDNVFSLFTVCPRFAVI